MSRQPGAQRGMALLTAMLTVTLVATFAAAALWQQWRSVEIEAAERSRSQMQWVLNGALDWARLILQEDARSGSIDHLSEPWALPFQEARLSSFLAVDADHDESMDAFLSGQISDQQGLLNVRGLVVDGKPRAPMVQAFARLFEQLRLPRAQLDLLVQQLSASDSAQAAATAPPANGAAATPEATAARSAAAAQAPFAPWRFDQLTWFGLPRSTVLALAPHATLLPVATAVNLNTAGPEVLVAALPGLTPAQARELVARRASAHFRSVEEALRGAGLPPAAPAGAAERPDYSVGSRFFTVRGRLRLGALAVQEVSLVEREGREAHVLWRQREAQADATPASLQ